MQSLLENNHVGAPLLTVIMSCYNQAKYIRQAIESVLMQKTGFPFTLLITDDCSTQDDSRAIIAEYASRYPERIETLLNETNGRYLANVLRAKARLHTKYFTLLDADDFWTDEHYLQDAVDFLRAHADYAVYFRDVVCLEDDGRTHLFLPNSKKTDFDFADYIGGRVLIPQTTGAVFRNVIYGQGIPKIVADAVGTIHERSFEGDAGRFVMHLSKGKAHCVHRPSGVYRISPSGIWCRLSQSERHLIQAQSCIDYHAYLGRDKPFFVNAANQELNLALLAVRDEILHGNSLSVSWDQYFRSISSFLSENHEIIGAYKLPRLGVLKALKIGCRLTTSQIPILNRFVDEDKLHKRLQKWI